MRAISILGIITILGLLTVLVWVHRHPGEVPEETREPLQSTSGMVSRGEPLLGDALLENYANPEGNIEDDLRYIQRLLMSVQTLVKTQDPGRMAVNEDVVDVLLGKNDYQIAFLSERHPAINKAGQLIDRWGSPLFFHLEAADRLDVRSAGADRTLFTKDDCHLQADGAFMPGHRLTGSPRRSPGDDL